MNSIIVYIDFSPSTWQTVRYAAKIANAAKLKLVVAQDISVPNEGNQVMIKIHDLVREIASKKSNEISIQLQSEFPDIEVSFIEVLDDLTTAIQHQRTTTPIELLVIDKSQYEKLEKRASIPPLEKLLMKINCPLMLVPGNTDISIPMNPTIMDFEGTKNIPQLIELQQRYWGKEFKLSSIPQNGGVYNIQVDALEKEPPESFRQVMSERLSASLEKLVAHNTDLLIIRIPMIARSEFWKKLLFMALNEKHIPCLTLPHSFNQA